MNTAAWTSFTLVVLSSTLSLGCLAQTTAPATGPAGQATTATAPATGPAGQATTATAPATGPALDTKALAILKDLEAAGEKFTKVRTEIEYTVRSVTLGDKEVRTGWVLYDAAKGDKPARFRIHFDTRKDGDKKALKDVMDYAFDGQWMSIADHQNKKIQQLQVAAPGQKVEPLRLGKGPFPLPFGQKVDDVLEYFQVTTREPATTDPANTRYIKLVPKPAKAGELNFTEIEQWVDNKLNVPVKLVAREKNKAVSTVIFGTRDDKGNVIMDTAPKINDSDFKFERPTGWQFEVKRLEERR